VASGACEAGFCRCLEALSVTELLLRRSLLLLFGYARDALDDACLLQADRAAVVTFWCALLGRGVDARSRELEGHAVSRERAIDGRLAVVESWKVERLETMVRLCDSLLHIDGGLNPNPIRGSASLCLSGWPTTERHTKALIVPTFLFMITAAGTFRRPQGQGYASACEGNCVRFAVSVGWSTGFTSLCTCEKSMEAGTVMTKANF
jgi:hypothetical protein